MREYYYFLVRKEKYKKIIGIFRFDKSKNPDSSGEYFRFKTGEDSEDWDSCIGSFNRIRNEILKGRPYSKTSPERVEELLFLKKL